MKVGDLVYIKNGRGYVYTKLGSWGYVRKTLKEDVVVEWHHTTGQDEFGEDLGMNLPVGFSVGIEAVRVLPDPPETKEEITELVRVLARLEAGE